MKYGIGFLLCFSLIACSSGQKDKSSDATAWSAQMKKTALSLQKLLPYLYNPEKFSDPKNEKKLKKGIASFKNSIHKIDKSVAKKTLGDDPYVLQSLTSLQELTDRANDSFLRGDRKNSRILLKATTNTCFKCHTRQSLGTQNKYWKNFNVDNLETSTVEKAHLLVAMRQYEDAKLYLKEFLKESEDNDRFDVAYESALHYYLMISLRGQKTFQSSLDFIRAKALVTKTPGPLHATLNSWAKDLQYWIKNQSKLAPTLGSARNILKRNKKPYSERNLINNLVASSMLHDYLMTKPPKDKTAKAYYLLGRAYDELIVEGFWDLPEVYYEMCVRYQPKSKLARACFKKFKNNITFGYSGSRGTMVPNKEYDRIEELRNLSGLK